MKILPKEIRIGKFDLKQVYRDGDIAIYRQTKGNTEAFEVIKVQKHNGYSMLGKYFPPSEFYPRPEDWGTKGWTCLTLAESRKKAAIVSSDVL